jgi:hypothetical protein
MQFERGSGLFNRFKGWGTGITTGMVGQNQVVSGLGKIRSGWGLLLIKNWMN